MDEDKIEDMPDVEEKVEDRKDYVCMKKCFWNKVYNLGDPLVYSGGHPMLKNFKVKKVNDPVEEVLGDDEPTTLAGLEQKTAQETIDSIGREGLDVGLGEKELAAGQAPVEGPPVSPAPDDVVQTDEVPTRGLAAEPNAEDILE